MSTKGTTKPDRPAVGLSLRRPCPACRRHTVMVLGERPALSECQSCGLRLRGEVASS